MHGEIDLLGESQNGGLFSDFNFGDIGNILSGVGSLAGAYGGLQALNLGKEQFQFGKDLSLTNLSNQANLTNAELTDRQDRRNRNAIAGSGGNPLSTAEYLAQFGVSGVPGQTYAQSNPQQQQLPPAVNNTQVPQRQRLPISPPPNNGFNFGRV